MSADASCHLASLPRWLGPWHRCSILPGTQRPFPHAVAEAGAPWPQNCSRSSNRSCPTIRRRCMGDNLLFPLDVGKVSRCPLSFVGHLDSRDCAPGTRGFTLLLSKKQNGNPVHPNARNNSMLSSMSGLAKQADPAETRPSDPELPETLQENLARRRYPKSTPCDCRDCSCTSRFGLLHAALLIVVMKLHQSAHADSANFPPGTAFRSDATSETKPQTPEPMRGTERSADSAGLT